ncbi:MFS transporter [Streptomyces sp. NPDC096311]|uniref:MFS transporter n=1 Tax=Streptomyces sp. NPDC096311 TaxID=3366083 RepID=UPI0038259456
MTAPVVTEHLAEFTPHRAPLPRLLAFLLPTSTAMFAAFNGVQQILMPAQVERIDAAHKVGNLALLTTFVGIASMVAVPLGGSLSDLTRSRHGRRAPWIVVLSLVTGVLMIAMGFIGNLALLALVYTVCWLAANMFQGSMNAILPDRIPLDRRGMASAIIGLGAPLGTLVGVNVASRVGQLAGYTVLAVVLVVTSLTLVLGARDRSSMDLPARAQRRRIDRRVALSSYFVAFRNRDFTMAFLSRFALFLSYFSIAGYLYYTVSDYIGADKLPGGDVAGAVSTLSTINVVTWVVVATGCGWLADKLDRRKVFVGVAAVGLGACMLIPIVSPTWTGMVAYSIVSGACIGTYFAVDLALMSMVLPNRDREGRDFGLLASAAGVPTVISALVAGALISVGGGYPALYVFGTVMAALGGGFAFCIRKVR